MITLTEYLNNPCGTLSIPYWKAKNITIPREMKILHNKDFSEDILSDYTDEKYFRLYHNLNGIPKITNDDFEIVTATRKDIKEIVQIINDSYTDISVNKELIKSYTKTSVYNEDLWVMVKEKVTGKYVGCGIADFDTEAKELILEWIQVLPQYRGKKIGKLIVTELLCRMKDIADFATVSGKVDNTTNPEALYRKCGFAGNDVWHILHKEGGLYMNYKAIFFDRDGTLTYFTAEKEAWRDKTISEWSGKPFELSYEKMMDLFHLASEGRKPWYKTLQDEREFFKRYYYHLLIGEGVTEDVQTKANLLFDELWCNGDRALFAETVEVLEYFKSQGYKMGVISDTSPSLEFTLQQLGIAKYFTSFTASSLVGAGKPSPIIFNAALEAQGVTASESIFVDDCKEEADGAREQGFTAFYLDRSGENNDERTIHNLKELIEIM